MQEEFKSKKPKILKYWVAVVAYLVVLVLSIFCLIAYVPSIPEEDRITTLTLLVGFLVVGTLAIIWETIQWRKQRGSEGQEKLEDVIRKMKDDANRGTN
jgi:hypothetical protein